MTYPVFFSKEDRYHRHLNFVNTCKFADKIVCISEYVRKTVLQNSNLDPSDVETVHIKLPNRLSPLAAKKRDFHLSRRKLKNNDFLFFPANFWQHKNHEILFTAFSIYCKQYPQSSFKLVCTGFPCKRMEYLTTVIKKMGLDEKVIFAGYVSNDDFSALLSGCRA